MERSKDIYIYFSELIQQLLLDRPELKLFSSFLCGIGNGGKVLLTRDLIILHDDEAPNLHSVTFLFSSLPLLLKLVQFSRYFHYFCLRKVTPLINLS